MTIAKILQELAKEHAEKYDPQFPVPMEEPHDLSGQGGVEAKSIDKPEPSEQPRYPTAQCLLPDEVLLHVLKERELPESRAAHVSSCLFCQSLLAQSQPDESMVQEMGRLLAQPPHSVAAPARKEPNDWIKLAESWAGELVAVAKPILATAAVVTVVLLTVSPATRRQVGGVLSGPSSKSPAAASDQDLLRAYKSATDGEHGQVLLWSNRVLERDPRNADALFLRANARLTLGDLRAAQEDCEQLIELDPDNRMFSRICSVVNAAMENRGRGTAGNAGGAVNAAVDASERPPVAAPPQN